MKAVLSVILALSLLLPSLAYADEIQLTAPEPVARIEGDPLLRARLAKASPMPAEASFNASLGEPILSRGAKTAIIVVAIVGGVLLIAGVIVLAKPGKGVP